MANTGQLRGTTYAEQPEAFADAVRAFAQRVFSAPSS
jgi:hypothetical protein